MDLYLSKFLEQRIGQDGLTITKLARQTSIPQSCLSDWLAGRYPSGKNLKHILTLAKFFNVTLEELLFNQTAAQQNNILFASHFTDKTRQYRIIVEQTQN